MRKRIHKILVCLAAITLLPSVASAFPRFGGNSCWDVTCDRGDICEEGECVTCTDYPVQRGQCSNDSLIGHRCETLLLNAVKNGEGSCEPQCSALRLNIDICTDSRFLRSICGQAETELWLSDVAAQMALQKSEGPDAVLSPRASRSECFRVTQGQEPAYVEVEAIVPTDNNCQDEDGNATGACLVDGDETAIVKREVYNKQSSHQFSGMTGNYLGLRQRQWINATAGRDTVFDQQRATWEANGNQVESCEEYTYEKYYDYSKFEDAVEGLGNDYWAVYDIAFENAGPIRMNGPARPDSAIGSHGMVGRVASARNGDPIEPPIAFPLQSRRNAWFRFEEFAGPDQEVNGEVIGECGVAVDTPTICNPDLLASLNAAMAEPIDDLQESWDWHYAKGQAIRDQGILDEEFAYYEQLNERLVHTRGLRADALRIIKLIMMELYLMDGIDNIKLQEAVPNPHILTFLTNPALLDDIILQDEPVGIQAQQFEIARLRGIAEAPALVIGGLLNPGVIDGALLGGQAFGPQANAQPSNPPAMARMQAPAQRGLAQRGLGRQAPAPAPVMAMSGRAAGFGDSNDGATIGGNGSGAGTSFQILDRKTVLFNRLRNALEHLESIDRELEMVLSDGLDAGCFRSDDGNPCEWTPKLFAQRVLNLYSSREIHFQRCQDATAESGIPGIGSDQFYIDFNLNDDEPGQYPWIANGSGALACRMSAGAMLSYAQQPNQAGVTLDEVMFNPGFRWNADTTHLDHYMDCQESWKQLLVEIASASIPALINESGEARNGEQKGDTWSEGNDDFGIQASYGFGWAVGNFDEWVASDADDACILSPEVYGFLDVGATVFSQNFEVLDASAHIRSENTPGETAFEGGLPPTVLENQIDVEIMGIKVWNKDLSDLSLDYNIISGDHQKKHTLFEVQARFTIGFIPVLVGAGVTGVVGLKYSIDAKFEGGQTCTSAEVAGKISPYTQLDAVAYAAVDLLVVQAGVKVDLTLIRADLPLAARVALEFGPEVTLVAEVSLKQLMTVLSGRFMLYLKFFIGDPIEQELFKWDGLRFETILFEVEATLPLFSLAKALYAINGEG